MAVAMSDFPAPVSPVSTLNLEERVKSKESISTKSRILKEESMYYLTASPTRLR